MPTRGQVIRASYRERRYMEHLTTEQLEQRAKDILVNVIEVTPEARIGLPPVDERHDYWMTLWAELLTEFAIRHGPYPGGFTNGFMPPTASRFDGPAPSRYRTRPVPDAVSFHSTSSKKLT